MENKMDRFQNYMERKLVPIATKIGQQRHLSALRDGLTLLVPLTIIGGITLMIANPPVDSETIHATNIFFKFLLEWKQFSVNFADILSIPFNLSIGVISIYIVLGISYRLAQSYNLLALPNAVTALFSFLIITAIPRNVEDGHFIDISKLGTNSMFTAIVVALAVTEINYYLFKHNIKIKMPSSIPPMVAAPFEILIPMVVNMLLFLVLDNVLRVSLGIAFCDIVFMIFQPIISTTSSLPSMIIIVELTVIFWFFGIHGDNMVSFVTTPIFTGNLIANLDAYQQGKEIPNIVAGNFTFIFGLAIVYLAILFNLIFVSKSETLRALGKMAIPSSLFNINEPLVFGVPTVLNVLMLIPSLICVPINVATAYILTSLGVISKTTVSLPWTIPAPLYALLSTMDWRAMIVWLVLFIINFVIFIPFIKTYDRQLIIEAQVLKEAKEN